jgi:acyl carrier protein
VFDEVLRLVGDITGYAPEELSADDELEADLGVDTVKQAEVVARLRDRFQLEHDPNFRLSQLKSLRDLADYAGQHSAPRVPHSCHPLERCRMLRCSSPLFRCSVFQRQRRLVPSRGHARLLP